MSAILESKMVGDVAVWLGFVEDWFRINYVEARTLFDTALPAGPVLYRHRFIDEGLTLPVDSEVLAQTVNLRTRRESVVLLDVGAAVWMRHRRNCPEPQDERVWVDLAGEMIDIDGQLVSVIRCRSCLRTATLTAEVRKRVLSAPFIVGGYLSPTTVESLV